MNRYKRLNRSGFTLIELVMVMVIIGMLAMIIVPKIDAFLEDAKVTAAIADIKTFATASNLIYADTGHWPTESVISFMFLTTGSIMYQNNASWDGWNGPYLNKLKTYHPWGGYYICGRSQIGGSALFETYVYLDNFGGNGVPDEAAQKIDDAMDDGNLSAGDVRFGIGGDPQYFGYIIEWDAHGT